MPLKLLVINKGPLEEEYNIPSDLLQIFQSMPRLSSARPYSHQAEVFRRIGKTDQEVLLVAGTAAGKTLALAVPLFWKLQEKRIRRVLFMYPTLALLEDQRNVMDQLAEVTGLETGDIKGGLTRSQLIASLNKHVILATPDAIYWFFRKNVKYNALLIYGLCQVDEFVLDEAHLFNGLMLRNFQHLWQRIKTLAGHLGKAPRLHILTATPTEDLRQLNKAEEVPGKSKGYDVTVEFRPSGSFDRADQFVGGVNEMLEAGQRRPLVVCNSARIAHQLFEKYSVDEKETSKIPVEHRLRFGRVRLGELIDWLERSGIEKDLLDQLNERLFREDDIVLADVPLGAKLQLPLEEVVLHANEVLERQCWQVKRALWQRDQRPGETWKSLLNNRSLPCCIFATVRKQLEHTADVEEQQAIVDEWLAETVEMLCNMTDDLIDCQAKEFAGLTDAFISAGVDKNLASLLTRRLTFKMKADRNQLSTRHLSHRLVYLRWLDWLVDEEKADRVREIVKAGLGLDELKVECRHVGLWKGTDVPVIVYSGSMAKQAREGLIKVFADPRLERAVLISTSAVEVGVDFRADTLITEECEGNSFLQRFGRVGRHDVGCKVITFVSGDTHAKLAELDGTEISREDFSAKITEVFPRRNYAVGSQLLDASHYLINEQLGRIGKTLNAAADVQVKSMAERLRAANLQLGFGLRSTMPQIGLRDGITKDPFYLLRYVDDQDLRPADSPFEVARAKTWFTGLIFRRTMFDVIVDLHETLKASQHLLIWHGRALSVVSARGIGLRHLNKLVQNVEWSKKESLYFILLHGDVYLSRLDRELEMPTVEPVRDAEGDSLFIPDQTYLVLWKWTDQDNTRRLLEGAGVADWEELHYDWDRLKENRDEHAMVILEKTTGACFAAYKELVDYVNC